MPLEEITVYEVQVYGVIKVQADNAENAKAEALTYFSQDPQNYLSVLSILAVLVEGEAV